MARRKTIILGAAGRDFHNFNVFFRSNPDYEVVAFTAEQIPDIAGRKYPKELAGKLYPEGIPIFAEAELPQLIKRFGADVVCFSYSDVSYDYVMHRSALANANGCDFMLLGTNSTMLKSRKPVISVTAARTGCGKSQTSRKICEILLKKGKKVVAVRHPMPYGDLVKQRCQRFSSYDDMKAQKCTIEEMEEYEPYVSRGMVVYAGVDYGEILAAAEKEADIILWDGGNNDFSFYRPDLKIMVADPLRAGDELRYYPSEVNLLMADVIIINKMDSATPEQVSKIESSVKSLNPKAAIIHANSPVKVDDTSLITGKRVLVIEDGPTVTHGGMKYGAGMVAAKKFNAKEIIDPKKYAVGKIKETYQRYPNVPNLLPAMGYGDEQIRDLQETINKADCDAVVIGTPIDLGRLIKINKPHVRVEYSLDEIGKPDLAAILEKFIGR